MNEGQIVMDTGFVAGPIRVVTANLAGAISEVLHISIEQQPDMKLIQDVRSEIDTLLAGAEADIMILGAESSNSMPGVCTHLINEYPHLKIVVVIDQENLIVCYWMDLQERRIKHITSETIMSTVRWLYQHTPGW